MFTNTQGKGFSMRFANGFGISVQWGPGNYCENRDAPWRRVLQTRCEDSMLTSLDAECAVLTPQGKLAYLSRWGDQVKGYMSTDDVLSLMVEIAAYPADLVLPTTFPSHADEED